MKNAKLVELAKSFKSLSEVAKTEMTEIPASIRSAIEMSRRQAQTKLPEVKVEYSKEVAKTVIKLFISASKSNSLAVANLLKNEGVPVILAENVYDFLAENARKQIGNTNTFTADASIRLKTEAMLMGAALGISPRKEIEHQIASVANDVELYNLVKNKIREVYGDELNKAYLAEQLVSKALDVQHSDDVIWLLVPSVSKEEQSTLASLFDGRPSFSVEVADNEKPAKTMATKILNKVAEHFKTQKDEIKNNSNKEVK